MFKKIISMCLAALIFTAASNAGVFAQTAALNENQTAARRETTGDLKAAVRSQDDAGKLNISNKSTLAEYERQKKQSKGMSTTTKVLIGVGVAVGVIAIVAIVASRDKIRTF